MINSIISHIEKYTNINRNTKRDLIKNVRQLANGDNLSKAYVSSIITSTNGKKFTQNQVANEKQKLTYRKDLRALHINKNFTNSNVTQLYNVLENKLKMMGLIDKKRNNYSSIIKTLRTDLKSPTLGTVHELLGNKTKLNALLKKRIQTYNKELNKLLDFKKLLSKISSDFKFNYLRLEGYAQNTKHGSDKYFYEYFIRRIEIMHQTLFAKGIQTYGEPVNKFIEKYTYNPLEEYDINHKIQFLKDFYKLYLQLSEEYLKIKKYYGKTPTVEKAKDTRQKIYSNNYASHLLISNKVPLSEKLQISNNALNQQPEKKRKMVKNFINSVNLIPSSMMYGNKNLNGYITRSGSLNSTNLNIQHIRSAKKVNLSETKLTKLSNIERINNISINQLRDISILVWLDMKHDFKTRISDKYIGNSKTLYEYIYGTKNINYKQSSVYKLLEKYGIVKNDKLILSQMENKLFNNLENMLDSNKNKNKFTKTTYNKLGLSLKNSNNYYVSIDARKFNKNISSMINKNKIFIPFSAFVDPGSSYLETKHVFNHLKFSMNKKYVFNTTPFSLNVNGKKIGYVSTTNENTKRNTLKLKINNKLIKPGFTTNTASDIGTYNAYLSKTFGDLMHILEIASITNKKIFFLTQDATAAFVYGYIRKFIFGQNDINLIVHRGDFIKVFK